MDTNQLLCKLNCMTKCSFEYFNEIITIFDQIENKIYQESINSNQNVVASHDKLTNDIQNLKIQISSMELGLIENESGFVFQEQLKTEISDVNQRIDEINSVINSVKDRIVDLIENNSLSSVRKELLELQFKVDNIIIITPQEVENFIHRKFEKHSNILEQRIDLISQKTAEKNNEIKSEIANLGQDFEHLNLILDKTIESTIKNSLIGFIENINHRLPEIIRNDADMIKIKTETQMNSQAIKKIKKDFSSFKTEFKDFESSFEQMVKKISVMQNLLQNVNSAEHSTNIALATNCKVAKREHEEEFDIIKKATTENNTKVSNVYYTPGIDSSTNHLSHKTHDNLKNTEDIISVEDHTHESDSTDNISMNDSKTNKKCTNSNSSKKDCE